MTDPEAIPNVVSFYVETSAGGLPITLCACGVLIYQPMAEHHALGCEIYRQTRTGKATDE